MYANHIHILLYLLFRPGGCKKATSVVSVSNVRTEIISISQKNDIIYNYIISLRDNDVRFNFVGHDANTT